MEANLSGVLLRLTSVVVHPVICLDISVELNRIETVNIGLAREQRGIIKRNLRCDIEWPFKCHAVRYVLLHIPCRLHSIN
jgi:hypothetical protein